MNTSFSCRERLNLAKDEIDHDDSNSSDDAKKPDNTVIHDDTFVLKEDLVLIK